MGQYPEKRYPEERYPEEQYAEGEGGMPVRVFIETGGPYWCSTQYPEPASSRYTIPRLTIARQIDHCVGGGGWFNRTINCSNVSCPRLKLDTNYQNYQR